MQKNEPPSAEKTPPDTPENSAGISRVFHNPKIRRFLLRLRVPLCIAAAAGLLYFVRPELLFAGVLVSLVGQFIQLWSFASLDKNSSLAVRGPYVFVRNPMYLGRYFLFLGFLITAGFWILPVIFTPVYWLYMDARVRREEVRLRNIFGEKYEKYCTKTRRFIPSLPARGHSPFYWNWRLFSDNHAARNFGATLVAWIAVFAICAADISSDAGRQTIIGFLK